MKRKTAYKIAIEAMEFKRRKDAVYHNSFLRTGDLFEHDVRGHKRYMRLTEAMKIIMEDMENID